MPKESLKKIAYGDIFAIGDHLLACADSRDAEFINRLVGKRKIKLICSDPPYSVAYAESKTNLTKIRVAKKILNDSLSSETEYTRFTAEWLAAIVPHLERKNNVYIFNSDKMLFALRDGMERAGIHFSQLLIWIKNHSVIGRKDYLPAHELIAYGWHGTHEFRKAQDKTLLYYPKPSRSPDHPTQKPVGLLRRLILNSTNLHDVVYVGFAGSGSTGLAAEQTKRSAILIERDEEYCRTILTRLEQASGMKPRRIA